MPLPEDGCDPLAPTELLERLASDRLERIQELERLVAYYQAELAPKPFTHRHMGGGFYRFIGFAHHTETDEPLAVYEGSDGRLWVRPKVMFTDPIRFVPIERVELDELTEGRLSWALTKENDPTQIIEVYVPRSR